jgi:hypothetical protein
MEFTTPASYGTTTVAVGGIVTDTEIIYAGTDCTASHIEVKGDPEVNWPEPSAVSYSWKGKGKDGTEIEANLIGPLGVRRDRIDIMAEVPKFVKSIVASAAGTRPYIYQVCVTNDTSLLTTANIFQVHTEDDAQAQDRRQGDRGGRQHIH